MKKGRIPGIHTSQKVFHSCGHWAVWLFDADRDIQEAATRHMLSQYPCPACGGETGEPALEGKGVEMPTPPCAVRLQDFGATAFVECEPEEVLIGI